MAPAPRWLSLVPFAAVVSIALAAIAGLLAISASSAPGEQGAAPVVVLKPGKFKFWPGPYVEKGGLIDPGLCSASAGCRDYRIDVSGRDRGTLRVALDQDDPGNDWTLQLLDPDGALVDEGETTTTAGFDHHFDVELFAEQPAAGSWTLRVVPRNVVQGDVHLRAKLERALPQPHTKGRKPELPNIQADPPYDLTFTGPLPQIASFHVADLPAQIGLHHIDSSVLGVPAYSCLSEESIENGAERCLRFSSGVANDGPGVFEVVGGFPLEQPGGFLGGRLTQRLHRSDGSYRSVAAGKYVFHKVHLHYHVADLANFGLFKVGAHHRLRFAGRGLKEGFCLANSKMNSFHEFGQADPAEYAADDCTPADGEEQDVEFAEAVVPGWNDVYDWQTSGQYVDFADNPNGRYLIKMKVNAAGDFTETTRRDNAAYTYFRVDGDGIEILERGRGLSPWDPHKQELDPVLTR